MYWSRENESVHHTNRTTAKPHESQNQCLQREVETYTRKFEEEKRKLFRVQENHREIFKNYQNQVEEFESLKTKKFRTQILNLNGRIKYLELDLEKGISSYNDSLSKNNSLKNQIDELRKHRKNQIQTIKKLKGRIQGVNEMIRFSEDDINQKKQDLSKFKEEILEIKYCNQQQAENCRENIDKMQKNVSMQDKMKETLKNVQGKGNAEGSDSQPIVKLRLKNLLHKNKDRIKVADQYKKNMQMIAKSFEEIKKESGINSLEEVTKIFLKQEEQNTFIYEYIGKLSNDLQNIKEENESIKEKIQREEDKIDGYRTLLNGTPEQMKRKIQIKNYLEEKNEPINKFNNFLKSIQSDLFRILEEKDEDDITFLTYEQKLADLQKIIDEKAVVRVNQLNDSSYKEEVTKYSKLAPVIVQEEVKQKNEELILEEGKLQEYASDFWEKKKSGK